MERLYIIPQGSSDPFFTPFIDKFQVDKEVKQKHVYYQKRRRKIQRAK